MCIVKHALLMVVSQWKKYIFGLLAYLRDTRNVRKRLLARKMAPVKPLQVQILDNLLMVKVRGLLVCVRQ